MAELELFQEQRPRLFSIAYRMLGSASDAEDVLQDAWVCFDTARTEDLRSPQAFATTIVTRLCLDRLKSARHRREEYVGPWLPEPVLTTGQQTPDVLAEKSESVTLAFLLLLEVLSAEERAVFLLKEVFDYEHTEIAEILGITSVNSRQLFHRAKDRVKQTSPAALGVSRKDVMSDRPENTTQSNSTHSAPTTTATNRDLEARHKVATQFAQAFQSGDASQLATLLAADVHFIADGGGKASAARRPLEGREEVLSLFVGLHRSAQSTGLASQAKFDVLEVNSQPALLVRVAGELDTVFVLSIQDGTVRGIQAVRNPDKLAYLKRQLLTQ
jgi:RNA polymerase sigma factor (sigma-70 family)